MSIKCPRTPRSVGTRAAKRRDTVQRRESENDNHTKRGTGQKREAVTAEKSTRSAPSVAHCCQSVCVSRSLLTFLASIATRENLFQWTGPTRGRAEQLGLAAVDRSRGCLPLVDPSDGKISLRWRHKSIFVGLSMEESTQHHDCCSAIDLTSAVAFNYCSFRRQWP